jgi:hypothetical protein
LRGKVGVGRGAGEGWRCGMHRRCGRHGRCRRRRRNPREPSHPHIDRGGPWRRRERLRRHPGLSGGRPRPQCRARSRPRDRGRLPDMGAFGAAHLPPLRRKHRLRLVSRPASRTDNQCCHRKSQNGRLSWIRRGPIRRPNPLIRNPEFSIKCQSSAISRALESTGDSL